MYANSYRQHPFSDYSNKNNRAKVKVNRSNMESDFVLPCYTHWDVKHTHFSGYSMLFDLSMCPICIKAEKVFLVANKENSIELI